MRDTIKNDEEKPLTSGNHRQKGARGINQLLIAGFIPMGKPAFERTTEETSEIAFSGLDAEGLPPEGKMSRNRRQ